MSSSEMSDLMLCFVAALAVLIALAMVGAAVRMVWPLVKRLCVAVVLVVVAVVAGVRWLARS